MISLEESMIQKDENKQINDLLERNMKRDIEKKQLNGSSHK